MKLLLPDCIDEDVRGCSVTFWSDKAHKWLLQYSVSERLPCFCRIDGLQRRITVAFDPEEFYQKCAKCVVTNSLPESPLTIWPSMDIGVALKSFKVYANVPADEQGMENFATRELTEFLTRVIVTAPELAG